MHHVDPTIVVLMVAWVAMLVVMVIIGLMR